jgi:hypothetical protein
MVSMGERWNGSVWVPHMLASSAGTSWTTAVTGNPLAWTNDYAPAWGLFIASSYFDGSLNSSPDGLNWTLRNNTIFSSTNYTWDAAYSSTLGRIVVVGQNGIIATSDNGIDWTQRTSGTTDAIYSVVWTGTTFWVCGASGYLRSSTDGITWTSRTSPFGSAELRMIGYIPNVDTLWLNSARNVRVSTNDGSTWSSSSTMISSSYLTRIGPTVATNGTISVAGLFNDTGVNSVGIVTSTNGSTWTERAFPNTGTEYNIYGVTWVG